MYKRSDNILIYFGHIFLKFIFNEMIKNKTE